MEYSASAQRQRIAEIKAAIQEEEERLHAASTRSSSPGEFPSTASSSSSHSPSIEEYRRAPVRWTQVQERMRRLQAWEAKCVAEDAAVRQLEGDVQFDMEAAQSRKRALMAHLQHLCREESLLKEAEAELREGEAALSQNHQSIQQKHQALRKETEAAVESLRQRQEELEKAQQDHERRQAARQGELKGLKDEISEMDAHTAEMEAETRAVVQRIADQERQARLLEASVRAEEASRIESLRRDMNRLLSQLGKEERSVT